MGLINTQTDVKKKCLHNSSANNSGYQGFCHSEAILNIEDSQQQVFVREVDIEGHCFKDDIIVIHIYSLLGFRSGILHR